MKVKETAMFLAIGIMFALFIGLLVDAIYEEPEYHDFCKDERPYPYKEFREPPAVCNYTREFNDKVNECYSREGTPQFDFDEKGCQVFRECNFCNKEFNEARKIYNRNVFFVVSPIAAASIIVGLLWAFQVIGTGFMVGGILLLIYSTFRYFSDMSKVIRVIVILIELLFLIWIAYKKIERKR